MANPSPDYRVLTRQTPAAGNGRVLSWDNSPQGITEQCRLLSLCAPAPKLDALAFLRSAYGRERFYLSEPRNCKEGTTIAGMGIAAEVRIPPVLDSENLPVSSQHRFDEVEEQAHRLFEGAILVSVNPANGLTEVTESPGHPARPRLFGGFAFQDDFVPDNTWSVFSSAHFVLPHYQYVRIGREIYLTINALVTTNEDFVESVQGLAEALLTKITTVNPVASGRITRSELRYPMSLETWRGIVEKATRSIHSGQMEKVVLSRVCEVRSDKLIDPTAALDYLETQYDDSFRFLFEPVPHHAFFGATPELLIRKNGDRFQTMALAGSIARGRNAQEDKSMAAQLLGSAKDRHEHSLVVDAIRNHLSEFSSQLVISSDPVVLPLRNIQHLLTPIEGRLLDGQTSILSLVRRLHPTPAMGGVPAAEALDFLSREESVPRGWYAAPIGWLDTRNDGLFAVAIRSAVTQHARAWLYAGAGIVSDSQPEREWAETALKFRPMLGALGIEESI